MTTVSAREMSPNSASGFTIIELVLFLAIGAALFASLMIGVNTNITQQRYRESVLEYASLLQNQYSEVLNTRNDRKNDWRCVDGTIISQPATGDPRGTTSCVILGRAVEIKDDGRTVQVTPVIGVEPSAVSTMSDIDALIAYQPKIPDSYDVDTTAIDWQSHLETTDNHPSTLSFLILRSPASGLLRVFTSDTALPSELSTLITPAAATRVMKNCVQGSTGALPVQSVVVDPRISGPNGVIINGMDDEC